MTETVASNMPFYPPRVKPAAAPLRFPFNLIKLLDNNLESFPNRPTASRW